MDSDFLTILCGDALEQLRTLPSESVQCCVTSPPYWGLRDYGVAGQLGMEKTPEEFTVKLVAIFGEVRRVLKGDGTCWVNLGDCYATGAGGVGNCPGGGKQGEAWKGNRGDRPGSPKHANGAMGPTTQPNRMPIAGLKPKDLVGIPWRFAFAAQAAGWYLRSEIIWAKPNPMPESVTDRPTKSHEQIFLLTKSSKYFYDAEAIKEDVSGDPAAPRNRWDTKDYLIPGQKPQKRLDRQRKPGGWDTGKGAHGTIHRDGRAAEIEYTEVTSAKRNKRSVWTVPTFGFPEAHFATFPPDLIKPCILAGSRPADVVLDPFGGSGTTGQVALELGRKAMLIELNPEYVKLIEQRCHITPGLAL